jgi:hypothetical protein
MRRDVRQGQPKGQKLVVWVLSSAKRLRPGVGVLTRDCTKRPVTTPCCSVNRGSQDA